MTHYKDPTNCEYYFISNIHIISKDLQVLKMNVVDQNHL